LSTDLHAARARRRRANRRASELTAHYHLWAFVALSALAAVAAPARPTGHVVVDAIYRAAFGALVAAAAGRASRGPTLMLAAIGLAASRGWWIAPAALAGGAAFAATLAQRRFRRTGAAVGAVSAQVLLHLHPVGFHGATALIAAAAVVPVAISAYRAIGEDARGVVRQAAIVLVALAVICSIPLAVAALGSRHDLTDGVHETRIAFDAASNADQTQTVAALSNATSSFRHAHSKAANPFTALAGLVPVVSQHRRALTEATAVAMRVTSTARTTARQADYGQLRYRGGRIDVARLAAMEGPLTQLRDALSAAKTTTDHLRGPWLVGPVDSRLGKLTRELDRALPDARLAAQAARSAPDLLGANGVRHYLVAFMTPAEQRGLGGFIGAWGEITADHGQLHLVRSGAGSDWLHAAPPGSRTLSGPADYLARYANFGIADSPADALYSPDLPMDAEVLAGLYPQSGGVPVDGVLALDPEALASLVSITGPIHIEGRAQPLTATNLAAFLLRDQYVDLPPAATTRDAQAARKDFLQAVLRTTFDRLTAGTLPGPRSLADRLSPGMHEGRLAFWSRHAADEALVRSVGLDGTFPAARGGDLLAVTTQNEGQNKIDVYLHRSIRYDVRTDPASGTTSATATVTLRNDAPAAGLPAYVLGNSFGLPAGTNATFMSLYSALGLDAVAVDGRPTQASSAREAGANAFGLSVKIPPGGTVTVVFHLRGSLAPSTIYRLALKPQPMVQPEQVEVRVEVTPDWRITGAAPKPGPLTTPVVVRVEARRR
jgi:hypothetical protein